MINDPHFREQIKKEINLYLEFNDNEEVSPPILWHTLKAVLRGKNISMCSYKKKMRHKTLEALQNKLKELEGKNKLNPSQDILREIKKIRNEIDNLT